MAFLDPHSNMLYGRCMDESFDSIVLTTVNAPYKHKVGAAQLAASLQNLDVAQDSLGQVLSFFTEVSNANQVGFVKAHGVEPKGLNALAAYLSHQTGQDIRSVI